MERTALVLGAGGGIGGVVARQLLLSGWRVRGLVREGRESRLPTGVEPVAGDAMDGGAVGAAATGAALVVHAVNPPGYRDWNRLVLPMIDNTIAAARRAGARILLPGTVYNFGPDALPDIGEDAPQTPRTRKGRIRAEMERRLQAEAAGGGAPALIVRAGDFFGPGAGNNWFSQGLVAPGARPRVVRNPATPGVGHQWAYLPDVAQTMVHLVERGDLAPFERFHMGGHWDADGTQMTAAIVAALGGPAVLVRPLPWWALRLAAPFNPTLREMMEMRYLWCRPVRLRNARLVARLGAEPHTPLGEAVRATLADMGCLG